MYPSLRNLLLAFLIASAWTTHATTWTPAGPFKLVNPVLALLPGASNTVIVSTSTTTLRGGDGGDSFTAVSGADNFSVLAPGPAGSGLVYGFGNGTTSRSTDGGRS